MTSWLETPLAATAAVLLTVVGSVLLWIAGTVFFDAVHWVLHLMLGSRWRVLRLLAWPHGVHHRFLDTRLRIVWENQRKNIWCHIVPEFLTQLAFSGVMWLVLPAGIVAGCVVLQVLVFGFILHFRGLDINHRPIEMLDAYQPSFMCPPAYHALHHVYPNAHFAAYNKLVDWAVGGGAQLTGRRFGILGGETGFGRALRAGLRREGVAEPRTVSGPDDPVLLEGELDVLVLCDPAVPEVPLVEAFIRATASRQLPPEVWVLHERADVGVARHYYRDVRVCYRTIVLPDARSLGPERARRAARTALFCIRRGFNYVPTSLAPRARREFRRFRRSAPERPESAPKVKARSELAA